MQQHLIAAEQRHDVRAISDVCFMPDPMSGRRVSIARRRSRGNHPTDSGASIAQLKQGRLRPRRKRERRVCRRAAGSGSGSRTIRDAVRHESGNSERMPACCGGSTGRNPWRTPPRDAEQALPEAVCHSRPVPFPLRQFSTTASVRYCKTSFFAYAGLLTANKLWENTN